MRHVSRQRAQAWHGNARPAGSLTFVHAVLAQPLPAVTVLPLALFRHRGLRFNFLLRYHPHFYPGPVGWLALRVLESVARFRRIDLTTDSARLAGQLGRLTDLPVHVQPIPHVPPEPPTMTALLRPA